MEYLLLILILGIVAACAIWGYEVLDAIERDEDERPAAWAERARAVLLAPVLSTSAAASSQRQPGHGWSVGPRRGSDAKTRPDADRLAARITRLELQLERLERECDRMEALPGHT
jgi:hypothetical protein